MLAIAALARIYGPEFIALAALLAIGVVAFVHARAMEGSNPRLAPALWLVSAIFFGWTIGFKALAWPAYLFVARAVPVGQAAVAEARADLARLIPLAIAL